MKTRMMKSCKLMALRFSERVVFFFFIIASIFHYGQSLSVENSGVYIQEGTVITNNSESVNESAGLDKEANPKITITGKGYLYIKKGTLVSGIEDISVSRTKKSSSPSSPKQKVIAKKEVSRKKAKRENLSASTQNFTTQPERNNIYAASLSGQSVCVTPGSHYQNFIFYHTIRYISAIQHDEYIRTNYHYRYSVLSKNIIDGGGIRPPPFHC